MKTILKWVVVVLVVFVLVQFANPSRTNPPVDPAKNLFAVSPPPPAVAALLRTSCMDCHSSETRWPWYSHVAPMSWLVANDVKEGRERLNFSSWPVTDHGRAGRKFGNISDEVDEGNMPPKKYTLIHRDAVLTAAQRQTILDWADAQAAQMRTAGTAK